MDIDPTKIKWDTVAPQIDRTAVKWDDGTSFGAGVVQGFRNPLDAAAQIVERGAKGIGIPTASINAALGMPSADEARKSASQSIADFFGGQPSTGGQATGELLATAGPLAKLARAPSLLGRLAQSGGAGAGFGALQPVEEGQDFAETKAKQIAGGGVAGVAGGAIAEGLGKLLMAGPTAKVQRLLDEGVSLTPGQLLGGFAKTAEEKLASAPLFGAAIRSAAARGNESLARVAMNRALAPIGEKIPSGIFGREAVEYTGNKLSNAYTATLGRIGATPVDQQLVAELSSLGGMLRNIKPDQQSQFARIVQNEIAGRVQTGHLTSEAVKAAESNLGQLARGYRAAVDYDTRVLGEAIDEARNSLRSWLERNAPPGEAEALKAINAGWANFKRIQRASSALGAEDGHFTAAQLQNAVKALDRSKDKAAFARGDALMQDLSEPAKTIMSSRIPNSGTADRVLAAAMVGAPLMGTPISPLVALGALPGLGYTTPGQFMLTKALQPRSRQAVANALRVPLPLIGAQLQEPLK